MVQNDIVLVYIYQHLETIYGKIYRLLISTEIQIIITSVILKGDNFLSVVKGDKSLSYFGY